MLALASAILVAGGCGSQARTVRGQPLTVRTEQGQALQLDELVGQQDATVLVFWSAGCPCVRRYQQRVDALPGQYGEKRVRVLGVSSNAGESLHEALAAARQRGVRIPIVRDEGGRLAEAVGARSTPTAVILDRRGTVRFLGWLDNERLPGDPARKPWLEQALQGVLDGRSDFAERTPVYGCPITRSLFGGEPRACCTEPKPVSERSP
jgi:peroxiredoxin